MERASEGIRTEEKEKDNISPVIFEVQQQNQCSSKWEIKYYFILI